MQNDNNAGMIDKREATADERLALYEWFQSLKDRYGTAKKVADMSGIAPTTITRFMKHWRTAAVPSTTTIRMIENGTGESFINSNNETQSPSNDFERDALDVLKEISPADREAVLATIRAFAKSGR